MLFPLTVSPYFNIAALEQRAFSALSFPDTAFSVKGVAFSDTVVLEQSLA